MNGYAGITNWIGRRYAFANGRRTSFAPNRRSSWSSKTVSPIQQTYILKRNIKTIGREDESDIALEAELENNAEELPGRVLAYLGGAANIKSITNCITRVRAKVCDRSVVDLDSYKEIGAKAVVTPGSDNVQLVYGSASEKIANTIKHMIAGGMGTAASVKPAGYQAFAEGRLIAINEVTDEVFSQKTMGDGYAIIPKNGRVVSPVDGKIDSIFPTKHAFGIVASDGKEIILHMGLDTVELDGDGFEIKVSAGDTVSAGQEIAVMDLERIQELGKDTVIIQVFTNIDDRIVKAETGQMVKAGEKIAVTME